MLLTSWDRDGTRGGYDLELLRSVTGAVRLPVIASGGVGELSHLPPAIQAGATGVLAASIFHQGDASVADARRVLADLPLETLR